MLQLQLQQKHCLKITIVGLITLIVSSDKKKQSQSNKIYRHSDLAGRYTNSQNENYQISRQSVPTYSQARPLAKKESRNWGVAKLAGRALES